MFIKVTFLRTHPFNPQSLAIWLYTIDLLVCSGWPILKILMTVSSNDWLMLVLRVSCLMQFFSQLNKIYKHKRENYNIVVSINLASSQSIVSYIASAHFNWCRHFDAIFFLLFNRLCFFLCATTSNFLFFSFYMERWLFFSKPCNFCVMSLIFHPPDFVW